MNKGCALPQLPPKVTSLDGQVVNLQGEIWKIRVSADGGGLLSIRWPKLTAISSRNNQTILAQRTIQLVRLYLADRLTQRKSSTVWNDFGTFVTFFQWLSQNDPAKLPFGWDDYDEVTARAFLRWCETTADKGNYFSRIRVFYEWGTARQYPEFDRSVLQVLKTIRIQGNAKGHHVRFRHPTKGPFSEAEKQLLVRAVQKSDGTNEDRALVMLHLELGANPHALVRLTNRDFICLNTQHGAFYQLDMPRVKKRTVQRETKRRPISRQLGDLILKLQVGEPDEPLLHWLSTDAPLTTIRTAMRRFARQSNLISPRTGKRLQLLPRRFRYTLATHLAAEGASKFHIAEVLDHTDLQNVEVYVETTPAIIKQVATATDAAMTPLVNRFLGKVVDEPDEAQTGKPEVAIIPAAASHIPLPMLSAGGVGVCGRNIRQDGLCRLFPPLSCYLCPSFAAWRSDIHQTMLTDLKAFTEAHQGQVDARILTQLDDIQAAISEVIAQCQVRKSDQEPQEVGK